MALVIAYTAAKPQPEEPYALVGRVRICGGAGGQPPALPGDSIANPQKMWAMTRPLDGWDAEFRLKAGLRTAFSE